MGAGPLTAGQVRRRSPFECVAASALLPASPAVPLPPLPAIARNNVGSPPGACTRPAASSAAAAARARRRLAAAIPRPAGRLPGRLHHRPVPLGLGGAAQLAAQAVQVRGGGRGCILTTAAARRSVGRRAQYVEQRLRSNSATSPGRPRSPRFPVSPAGRRRRTRMPRGRRQRASRCWRSMAPW